MNELMVKLFEQAGISDSINEEFGIEYLAELIVQECVNTLYQHGWTDAANDMKEHFGVKE